MKMSSEEGTMQMNPAATDGAIPGAVDFSMPTDIGVANELKMLSEQEMRLQQFWNNQLVDIGAIDPEKEDFKNLELPLARIKKIMRLEEEIQAEIGGFRFMISAEAPVLLARAAALFTGELTIRAATHTEESKRRTLQRQDIAMAMTKSDMYDFLIDIVPREEARASIAKAKAEGGESLDAQQMLNMQQQAMQAMMPGMMPGMMGGMGMDQMMQQQQMMMAAMSQMQNPQMQMMMQQAQAAMMQQQMMMAMGNSGNQGNQDGDDDDDDDDENADEEDNSNDPQQMMQKMMQQMMPGNNGSEGSSLPMPTPEQMQQMMQQMMPMMQMAMMAMQQAQNSGNPDENQGQDDANS